jgi:antitoxin component of RelBE/YafQ-DinJ toxin-antitoxin module
MNVTLALDETMVEDARRVAARLGKSLNQMIREYLEQLTRRQDIEAEISELRRLSLESHGDSKGWKFDRDELHERK